jgi:hypothetical protein
MTLSLTEGSRSEAIASAREQAMLAAPAYGHLPNHEKLIVRAILQAMERIDTARNKTAAIAEEARRRHAGVVRSPSMLRKYYYERWLPSRRDWRSLINRSRAPVKDREGLSPTFILHWHELFFRFMGRGRAAFRELQREWRCGLPIPGFAVEGRPHDLPPRATYATLLRKPYRPDRIVKRVARVGLRAASEFLPSVLSTRVGLAPGSFLLFDDIWHDLYATVPGQQGMRRVLQFHCLELLSGSQIGRGMKPEMLNADTGRMERLKEREMLFLLAHILGRRGYNPEKCLLVMELGTATVDDRVIQLLHDFSGGRLRIEKGQTSGSPIAQGLYGGQAKGNFKIKAALESLGNLVHNETGDRLLLPAQSGSIGRINEPEELHGRKRHLDQLQRAAQLVPAHLRELIAANVAPPFAQVVELLDLIQERMNHRQEHALEGWEACGFLAPLYRLSPDDPWSRQSALAGYPEAARAGIEAALRADPRLVSCRRMSPHEVYQERVQPHLSVLPPHLIPQLLGMEQAKERRVAKDGRIHFADSEVGPGEHHYEGTAIDENGNRTVLPDGEKYATFCSMLDPDRMYVCDARGRYLGYAPRTLVPTRGDAEGFAKACGQRTASARKRMLPVLRAAAPLIRRDAEAAENATDLLAQLGTREVERRAARPSKSQREKTARLNAELAERARENATASAESF